MSRPSCWAGPVSATDWPRTIWLSVTPCAEANVAAATATAARNRRFMVSPVFVDCSGNDNRGSAGEEVPYLVHEALGARIVARAVALVDVLQLAQQVLLAVGEAHRGLHHHGAQQVAGVGGTHALDALAAQAERLAALGLGRDLDLGRAVERGDLDLPAQRRLGEADRHLAVQVVPVSLEDAVLLEVDHHVEVAGGAPVHAGLPLAGQADAVALVHAGGDLHLQGLVLLDAAGPAAGRAGVGDHLAAAVAGGAGLLDGEEALRQAHRARAVAGLALLGLGARLGARAVAGLAGLHGRDADLGLGAARGLLERDLEVVAQVRAAEDGGAPARARAAEDVAEDVAEGLREPAEALLPRAAAHAHLRIHPGMPVGVVRAALLGLREHLVGLLRFLELLLGVLAVRIAVRVEFHRELAIGLLDVLVGGIPVHAEHFVVVALLGGHSVFPVANVKAGLVSQPGPWMLEESSGDEVVRSNDRPDVINRLTLTSCP